MSRFRSLIRIILIAMLLSACLTGCVSETAGDVSYSKLKDFEGKKIGLLSGGNHDTYVSSTWDNVELVYIVNYNDLLPSLFSGRVDAFMADEPWVKYVISSHPEVAYISEKVSYEDYGLIFPKNDKGAALAADFDNFFNSLPEAELQSMQEAWCNSDASAHPVIDINSLNGSNGTVSIGALANNPPFAFYENNELTGYLIELLYRFALDSGYRLEISDVAMDALLPGIVFEKYDIGCANVAITEERKESVIFSEPVYNGGVVLAYNTNAGSEGEQGSFLRSVADSFEKTFIREDRWKMFLQGILVTVEITVVSLLFGTLAGFLLFILSRNTGKKFERFTNFLTWFITGIPEVLFLLIFYYILFKDLPLTGKWVAIFGFSIIVTVSVFNMIKNAVSAIDGGQKEAALSLGYSDRGSFLRVIFPQALRLILPNYLAEITTLIKATAIVGYISVKDLTKISDIVRSHTFEAFFPLIITAALYFLLAWLLIRFVQILQEKLLPIRKTSEEFLKGVKLRGEEDK